jgi:hypothetical protein
MLGNCLTAHAVPYPHPQINIVTIVNGTENTLPQITILYALGHNYNSMSCDSEIPVHAYKTILLKQKKTGETGTKLRTGWDARTKSPNQNCPSQTWTYGNLINIISLSFLICVRYWVW